MLLCFLKRIAANMPYLTGNVTFMVRFQTN